MERVRQSPKFNKDNFYACYSLGALLGSGAYADVRIAVKNNKEKKRVEQGDDSNDCDPHSLLKRNSFSSSHDHTGRKPFEQFCKIDRKNCYAAKIIYKSRTSVATLARELQFLCDLPKHKNIASLHEWFDSGDLVVLILDLAVGGDILERLAAIDSFSELDAARIAKTVIQAVAFCHTNNVIHRDIKPENILYNDDGYEPEDILITDFGLGMVKSEETEKGLVFGTPLYMAPESLSRGGYGPKVDVYACGLLVFEMITGLNPFIEFEDDVPKLLFMITNVGVELNESMHEVFKDVSPQCKKFIEHLCNKDPEERPSAEEALQHPWLQDLSLKSGCTALNKDLISDSETYKRANAKVKGKPLRRAANAIFLALRGLRKLGSKRSLKSSGGSERSDKSKGFSSNSSKPLKESKSSDIVPNSSKSKKPLAKKMDKETRMVDMNKRSFDDIVLRKSLQFNREDAYCDLIVEERDDPVSGFQISEGSSNELKPNDSKGISLKDIEKLEQSVSSHPLRPTQSSLERIYSFQQACSARTTRSSYMHSSLSNSSASSCDNNELLVPEKDETVSLQEAHDICEVDVFNYLRAQCRKEVTDPQNPKTISLPPEKTEMKVKE